MITFIKIVLVVLLAITICIGGPAAIANILVAALSPNNGTKTLALHYATTNLAIIALPIIVLIIMHICGY